MTEQMFLLALLFLFAVIALIALGASSFIRLVALILENGSKLAQLEQIVLQALTRSSVGPGASLSSVNPSGSPITQENRESSLTDNTQTMK